MDKGVGGSRDGSVVAGNKRRSREQWGGSTPSYHPTQDKGQRSSFSSST